LPVLKRNLIFALCSITTNCHIRHNDLRFTTSSNKTEHQRQERQEDRREGTDLVGNTREDLPYSHKCF
jgi:hypothetical protein